MQIKLKQQPTDRKEFYKKFYGENWEAHYKQWQLFNTPQGSEQITKYVKSLEAK